MNRIEKPREKATLRVVNPFDAGTRLNLPLVDILYIRLFEVGTHANQRSEEKKDLSLAITRSSADMFQKITFDSHNTHITNY